MNIYKILNYPDYSREFLNLEIEYNNYFVLVTGFIEIKKGFFYISYNENLKSGGYTETEVPSIQLHIYEIKIYDCDEGIAVDNPMLEKEIILEIQNQTNC